MLLPIRILMYHLRLRPNPKLSFFLYQSHMMKLLLCAIEQHASSVFTDEVVRPCTCGFFKFEVLESVADAFDLVWVHRNLWKREDWINGSSGFP